MDAAPLPRIVPCLVTRTGVFVFVEGPAPTMPGAVCRTDDGQFVFLKTATR